MTHPVERAQSSDWKRPAKRRIRKVVFARAVYCPGVDQWFIRLGKKHGIDIMYPERSETTAKHKAKLINASLNRDLKGRL